MSGRPLHTLDDDALGRALTGLDLVWPAAGAGTAAQVLREIGSGRPRQVRTSRTKIVLLVAAALLAIATAAVGAKLVFDLGAISIEPVPSDRPLPTTSAIPLGEPVSLERAEAITGIDAAVPAALGPPDRVWVDEPEDQPEGAGSTRIVMAWDARANLPAIPGSPYGAVLIRWDAHVAAGVKLVGGDIRDVEVAGWPRAYWVADPHELVLVTDDGTVSVLVRGNVLLWGDELTTFRLESSLPLGQALAVAETTP